MQTKEIMTLLNKSTGKLETFNIHTGELVVRDGELVSTQLYTVDLADAIANLVREGHTYATISQLQGMPPRHMIFAWRNNHPDFAKKLKDARRDRATYHYDKAIEVLEESDTIDKEDVPRNKFRFDSFMKLAERGAPDEYAAQPKMAAIQTPATIIINTGINRQPVTIEGEVHGERSEIIADDGETEDGERREREPDFAAGIREAESAAREGYKGSGSEEVQEGDGQDRGSGSGEEGTYKEESQEEDQEESE